MFPVISQLRQEICACRRRFGEFLIFMKTVVADGGGAEKRDASRILRKGVKQMACGIEAAGEENLFLLFRPAAENGSPRKVDDDVMARDGFLPAPLKVRIADQIRPSGDCFLRSGKRLRENGDRMPGCNQLPGQG